MVVLDGEPHKHGFTTPIKGADHVGYDCEARIATFSGESTVVAFDKDSKRIGPLAADYKFICPTDICMNDKTVSLLKVQSL